jgi:hypothetical protein
MMNKIDEEIKSGLSPHDKDDMQEIEQEGGLVDLIGLSVTGPSAWLTYYMYTVGFGAFFAAVYLYVGFLAAADLKTSLAYALGIIICVFILFTVKIVGWQNMQRLEILREIKRVEMRIMRLSK